MRPYGLSKKLAEDLCEGFSARTGIATISLRPVLVLRPDDYHTIEERWRKVPTSEWDPFWEFGAFVDVRDVADAVVRALEVPFEGHRRVVLCAADICGSAPSLELAARLAPDVPVRGLAPYRADPWRALFDCAGAEELLGWRPRYRWSARESAGQP
jgi:UDP-glucose 4-epimerase